MCCSATTAASTSSTATEGGEDVRIRSTKPEFWRSDRIASVSWEARLVLKGLETYVDDNGVGKDDLELIVGDLFPRDLVREPSRTLARVSEAVTELSQAGLLHRYESDGLKLIYVSFWEQTQRVDKPQAGRFRRPDGTMNYRDSEIREAVAKSREDSRSLAPVTGEQGNRGTEEQRNRGDRTLTRSARGTPRATTTGRGSTATEINKRAQALASGYHERVPLSRFPAIMGVAKTALKAGYDDAAIEAALRRMAADNRAVTTDALRYELDGYPVSRLRRGPTQDEKIAEFTRANLPRDNSDVVDGEVVGQGELGWG